MNPNLKVNAEQTPAEKRLVLLVEEDQDEREYMRASLTKGSLSCVAVGSASEALEVLERKEVALLVLEWGPDKGGAEVLSFARKNWPKMPVVATSRPRLEVRTDAVLHKADAFLHKPLSGEVLRTQVMQLLERVPADSAVLLPERPEDTLPLGEIKRRYICHVFKLFDENISLAARALGIHRHTVAAALGQGTSAGTMPAERSVAAAPNESLDLHREDERIPERLGMW
ncbi:MAG TPA: response regulator [Candidatus Paceibacterota bacterium]|nr:response regulator [Verrucomicrobiota bacterium]HSA10900.1 response regulator [Candidatus Paceibacterota bacterium]